MKYALLFQQTEDIVEYTISVLRYLITRNGHELVDAADADLIAVSVCDITQVKFVERIKKEYPFKKIVVGGHAAIYYRLFGMFADYVNIGQGFEFFECKTLDEIEALTCVWSKSKDGQIIQSSTKIDWANVPLANVTTKQIYYWGAVGCKNKCKFCMTSWTNPHQKNEERRVSSVLRKYPNATIVTNDSDEVASRMTQSIMLKDFLMKPLKKYGVYRIGIEFATEATRRYYGKFFTDAQFVQTINRAVDKGVRLKLFCIGGINTLEEWRELFDQIPPIYQKGNFEVKFTNITYDMFTPMKRERTSIDPARMFGTKDAHDFVSRIKERGGWPFKALPCASPKDVLLRNALCYTTNSQEYELYNHLRAKSVEIDEIHSRLLDTFYLNDYSGTVKINHLISAENKTAPEGAEVRL